MFEDKQTKMVNFKQRQFNHQAESEELCLSDLSLLPSYDISEINQKFIITSIPEEHINGTAGNFQGPPLLGENIK